MYNLAKGHSTSSYRVQEHHNGDHGLYEYRTRLFQSVLIDALAYVLLPTLHTIIDYGYTLKKFKARRTAALVPEAMTAVPEVGHPHAKRNRHPQSVSCRERVLSTACELQCEVAADEIPGP